MSRVKPPQVLSHLLLVVTVFAFAAPNVPNKFSGSNPHKSYLIFFCGVRYVLNIVGTHENLGAPTRLVSRVENFQHLILPEKMANPMNNPIIILANLGTSNEHLGESQKERTLELPGNFLENHWKFLENS